jgi:hypothetical protein
MALTKEQFERVMEAIKKRFASFTYQALGSRALTEDEIKTLVRAGILKPSVRHMVADPYIFGKITAVMPLISRERLTESDILRVVQKTPMTEVERSAVAYATDHAGTYIKGIRDMVLKDAEAASSRARTTALRAVQEATTQAIAKRKTIREFKTSLFDMFDERNRDWQRVAHTEMNDAIQHGIYNEIRRTSSDGHNQLVFKRPAPDACPHCKRVYLNSDGSPRIFRMEDLADSNVGKKAANWEPTIGSVHPWCRCQLCVLPDGYDFKKMKVVQEPFDHREENYRRGQVIDQSTYESLARENQDKVADGHVLTYTGETAKPVDKSFVKSILEEDLVCLH